ncbi:uncharacterized protein LOC144624622 [Crassostrea virginica]
MDQITNDLKKSLESNDAYCLSELSTLFSDRALTDGPHINEDLNTCYGGVLNELHNVACLNGNEVWTSGDKDNIYLYNLKGDILKDFQTSSTSCIQDIAVTQSGQLLYTDDNNRSVNIVSNTQIDTLIKLNEWIPHGVCIASSGDFLVAMTSVDWDHTNVVRYSGSTEKYSIQWDDQGQPLFPAGYTTKYLKENKNLDICLADPDARAVMVVSAARKLRFKYTGSSSSITLKEPFYPSGITTDNYSKILIADMCNQIIHIVDKNSHFLRYIKNYNLRSPRGLRVDSKDNLFVAECYTGRIKKIQFYR